MAPVSIVTAGIVVLLFIVDRGRGFPMGAPASTCLTMFPKHGQDHTWTHSGQCPFEIQLSPETYTPDQNITVTIEAEDERRLRGIQISAHRKSVNTEEFQGTFVDFPDDKLQAFNCGGGRQNQLTHNNSEGVERLVLTWQAPDQNVGDIIFKATFVYNYTTFWYNEREELRTADPNSVVQPSEVLETATDGMDEIDFSGCGSDRGCFFYPRYCSGSDCDAAVSYRRNGELYTFEMMAKAPNYVTLALSKDTLMGGDNTMTCTAYEDLVSVQNGINPAYFNQRVVTRNFTNMRVRQTDTHVMCTFTRTRIVGIPVRGSMMNFDLQEPWYLMLAWGYVPERTDVISHHTELPVVSDIMIKFPSVEVVSGSVMSMEVRAHGSLMVVAWVLVTGLAVVLAAFYKDICQSKLILGTKVWFQVHRGAALMCLALVAISFVIIFVKLKALSGAVGETHAIIGITVGVAVLLQVFLGMIRPGPDSKVRPWFRWGHRLLGQATHILAGVNMYISFNLSYTPQTMSRYGSIAVIVWAVVQVLWELGLELWACRKNSSQDNATITSSKGMQMEETRKKTSSRVDIILLVLYCLCLIVFTIAILCGVNLF